MKLLDGKVVLVTGAARGIGRAIAEGCAAQGAKVAFTFRSSEDKARELEAWLQAEGAGGLAFKADAADAEAMQKVIDDTVAGLGRIDAVICNAGITQDTLLLRMSTEQWQNVIHTNLDSVFFATKAAIKHMLRQRSGSIIAISSVVGLQGNAGQGNYAASKAGMIGFIKSVAREVGSRGIRANAIAPGFIGTEMTHGLNEEALKTWLQNIPLQRAGTPEDVANLCVFLASDLSAYITGQVLNVDGGMVMA